MQITLQQAGKKYNEEWVFREVSLEIKPGDRLAILGSNGSGKTTLMKLVAAAVMPTEGTVTYKMGEQLLPIEQLYQELVFVAPYFELVEEFTLQEMVDFHTNFKPLKAGITSGEVLEKCGLEAHATKKVSACSSGMKQKLKLALGFFSDTRLLLLDEPLTNLDPENTAWYTRQIEALPRSRTLIVCSNHVEAEIAGCKKRFILGM